VHERSGVRAGLGAGGCSHGSGKLEDAGIRSSPAEDGAIDGGQGVLPAVMGPVKGYRVTHVCDSSGTMVNELGIQVSRGHGYGEVDGLRINYHVGNTSYESIYKSPQRCATRTPTTTRVLLRLATTLCDLR
jgi:hypothetical protein